MSKYRKKPVEIDGYGYNPETRVVVPGGSAGVEEYDLVLDEIEADYPDTDFSQFEYSAAAGFTIVTKEGRMHVSPGDVVIRGVQGEFYPCKPDIFAATYEVVSDVER